MTNDKLEKFKQLMQIASEGLTREEFLKSFKKILDHILKLETKLIEKINKAISEVKDENNASLESTKADLGDKMAKALKEQGNGLNFIRDKFRKMEHGKNGRDGRDGRDGQDGKSGRDADETQIIKNILEKIVWPELLVDDIKGLKETLQELQTKAGGRIFSGGGFSKIHLESKFIDDETPSGTINGLNTIFILANMPNPPSSIKVYVNGQRFRITEDYTLNGKTITFVTTPPTNSIILCDYRI